MKYNEKNFNIISKILCTLSVFIIVFTICVTIYKSNKTVVINNIEYAANISKDSTSLYLSDIPDDKYKVKTSAWRDILKDQASDGSKISVKVEGGAYTFDKGMWAHATSTLVYDISEYSSDYKYFTAYIGLNTTAASTSNGVIFTISTADDENCTNWKEEYKTGVMKAGTDSERVEISIEGKKCLKLYAYDNGGNGNDHSVYADAKLVKNIVDDNKVMSVEEYDKIIKEKYSNSTLDDKQYELTLLQRDFVANVGQFALKLFLNNDEEHQKVFDWLFYDVDNLRMYMVGGKPDGSYANSLMVLSDLYANKEIRNDLDNKKLLYPENSTVRPEWFPKDMTYGDLYKKMMITLSLTHSTQVALWMQYSDENTSDPIVRYQIYKQLHAVSKSVQGTDKTGGFKAWEGNDYTPMFEALEVEEMRFVLNNIIDDEEIIWLNEFTQMHIDNEKTNKYSYITPHPYIRYVWPDYSDQRFHTENDPKYNKDYWDQLYAVNGKGIFSGYGVLYKPGIYKVWMNLNKNDWESGSVCGGISKTGSNIRGSHGIPTSVISQPGHAALIHYAINSEGIAYWSIDNDVYGWSQSGKTERLSLRMPLGWGDEEYVTANGGWPATYILLAQGALNDFENYQTSRETIILADVYKDDLTKQEKIYREVLTAEPLNIDAWYGLIENYRLQNKSTEEFYNLGKEIIDALTYYPLPMYHLTLEIEKELKKDSENNSYLFKFTIDQTKALQSASVATDKDTIQKQAVNQEANYLLGEFDSKLAEFSFDGENAGQIVLSNRFDGSGIRWDYNLSGKDTLNDSEKWTKVNFTENEPHKLQLKEEELESITAENDIYIHIVGTSYDEENIYKIDITEGVLPENLYANDLENRVIGATLNMEWRISDNDKWTSYATASPDLTGDKTVEVRVAATGTALTSSSEKYTFTADKENKKRQYVSISHLSIEDVSSEATGQGRYATNAIDGNYNTNWHSNWNGTDTERYITIKVDRPIVLSAIEYIPGGGGNGKIKDGTIYGSIDGENWEVLANISGLTYTGDVNAADHGFKNIKTFEIDSSKQVQYIKIHAETTSNGANFFVARMFNIYEDASNITTLIPTANVAYSTLLPTNQDVVARITNPSIKIEKVINNDGKDTYTFTENGTFNFEVKYEGLEGTYTIPATVDWIDKKVPTATISYNTTSPTNQDVVATIKPSEDVIILNNGKICKEDLPEGVKVEGAVECKNISGNTNPFKYLFTENGTFTFEYMDKAGNIGKTTATVKNIDREDPTAMITYSTLENTDEPVVATLVEESEYITITNNGGSKSYTFTENGEFTFTFKDSAGNTSTKTANVTWINEKKPEKYICKEVNDKYYDNNGNVVDKSTYEKACGIETEQPTNPGGEVKPTNPGGNTSGSTQENNTSKDTNINKPNTNTGNNTSSNTDNTNNTVSDDKNEESDDVTTKPVDDKKPSTNEEKNDSTIEETNSNSNESSFSVWYYIIPIVLIIIIGLLITIVYNRRHN